VGRLSAASVHLVSRFRLSDRASSPKGRLNSFYLFGKISTTKTAAEEQRKMYEEQAEKWINAEELKTSAEEQRKEGSPYGGELEVSKFPRTQFQRKFLENAVRMPCE
jgi:hypothetical protein